MATSSLLLKSELLRSLGVPHCFTTRVGGDAGVSRGIFSTLNFGNPGDLPKDERDPPANIAANLHTVSTLIKGPGRPIIQVHQVHGGDVHTINCEESTNPDTLAINPRADAIVTNARVLAGIRTADCAPILLASIDGRVVAAVHAGWRGVIADVAANAVDRMRRLGATEVVGVIGPCIGPRAFEVDADVADQFIAKFGDASNTAFSIAAQNQAGSAKYTIDLQGALAMQLASAGVKEVETIAHCTFEREDWFFSHRRERGKTGRMIALIGPLS